MKLAILTACCVLFVVSMEGHAQSSRLCSGPQFGTWRLQSLTTEDSASGQKTNPFGANPSGYITYGPDCRMNTIFIKDGRKAPATLVPTDAERIELYSGVVAYAGTYTIAGDRITHHIDISWNQAWTGTTQVRQFRIDGNVLHITSLPARSALSGTESVSNLVWSKVE